jgi:hypothetical protein
VYLLRIWSFSSQNCADLKKLKMTQYSFYFNNTKDVMNSACPMISEFLHKLCYHARFFTATDSTKSKQKMSDMHSPTSQVAALISRGKEQGYLTYAEVNDHLPDSITESEQIEDIIQMLQDVGIPVHERAPESDDTMFGESTEAADEVAEEEAAAVLASVENEPGRTTDPVRMYMREMGTVELLTREGEISIAKRIEEGIRDVLNAIAYWPNAVEVVLQEYEDFNTGERRLADILSGYLTLKPTMTFQKSSRKKKPNWSMTKKTHRNLPKRSNLTTMTRKKSRKVMMILKVIQVQIQKLQKCVLQSWNKHGATPKQQFSSMVVTRKKLTRHWLPLQLSL